MDGRSSVTEHRTISASYTKNVEAEYSVPKATCVSKNKCDQNLKGIRACSRLFHAPRLPSRYHPHSCLPPTLLSLSLSSVSSLFTRHQTPLCPRVLHFHLLFLLRNRGALCCALRGGKASPSLFHIVVNSFAS